MKFAEDDAPAAARAIRRIDAASASVMPWRRLARAIGVRGEGTKRFIQAIRAGRTCNEALREASKGVCGDSRERRRSCQSAVRPSLRDDENANGNGERGTRCRQVDCSSRDPSRGNGTGSAEVAEGERGERLVYDGVSGRPEQSRIDPVPHGNCRTGNSGGGGRRRGGCGAPLEAGDARQVSTFLDIVLTKRAASEDVSDNPLKWNRKVPKSYLRSTEIETGFNADVQAMTQGCISLWYDQDRGIAIRCGKCPACVKRVAGEKAAGIMAEYELTPWVWHITFTVDDDHYNDDPLWLHKEMVRTRRIIVKRFKRLGVTIRAITLVERGSLGGRIHAHMLLFAHGELNNGRTMLSIGGMIALNKEIWPYGRVDTTFGHDGIADYHAEHWRTYDDKPLVTYTRPALGKDYFYRYGQQLAKSQKFKVDNYGRLRKVFGVHVFSKQRKMKTSVQDGVAHGYKDPRPGFQYPLSRAQKKWVLLGIDSVQLGFYDEYRSAIEEAYQPESAQTLRGRYRRAVFLEMQRKADDPNDPYERVDIEEAKRRRTEAAQLQAEQKVLRRQRSEAKYKR